MNKIFLATLITITAGLSNQTKAADPNLQNPRDHQHIADAQETKGQIVAALEQTNYLLEDLMSSPITDQIIHNEINELNSSVHRVSQAVQEANLTNVDSVNYITEELWKLTIRAIFCLSAGDGVRQWKDGGLKYPIIERTLTSIEGLFELTLSYNQEIKPKIEDSPGFLLSLHTMLTAQKGAAQKAINAIERLIALTQNQS